MVYFIECESLGAIKIGYSSEPGKRLKMLQTANPAALILLHYLPGNKEMEREIHERFKHLRINGEWFKADEELKEYISLRICNESWIESCIEGFCEPCHICDDGIPDF